MEHSSSTPIFDPALRATLHAELAAAASSPALRTLVLHPEPDLGPRFVGYWRQLSALPRRTRRSLQRRWKRSLAAIALLMALGQVPALAATIPVDGSTCTLVDAITAANTDAPTGGCTAGSGADTLELVPGSTHGLTAIADTTYGPSGLPLATSKITIAGHDSTIERANTGNEDPAFRLLAVSVTGDVTLKDLTLTKGNPGFRGGDGAGVFNAGALTLSNSSISGNGQSYVNGTRFYGNGGGIYSKGTLVLTDSTVSGNYVCGPGGGVFSTGTATVTNSTVSGNSSSGRKDRCDDAAFGGGLYNSGRLTVMHSKVTGNDSRGDGSTGGGITNRGILTVADSTISNNRTTGVYQASGGGIFTFGTATIINGTVSGNIVQSDCGLGCYGGGVANRGSLTVINSTISGNRAEKGCCGDPSGGGISNGGTLVLTHSTISDNFGGGVQNGLSPYSTGHTLTLGRNLISGNTATEVINLDGNIVLANAFNLFGLNGAAGVSGFSPGPRDIVPAEPLGGILAPLADNGGPTETHALEAGSPAVDAVTRGCPPPFTDQRGFARPADGDGDGAAKCDVGAFELAARPLPTCATAQPTRGCTVNGVANRLCRGTARGDQIFGTQRDDVIFGLDGNDGINGLGGNDLICGGTGNDILRGKLGRDRVFGGAGDDNLQGGSGNDQVSGQGGKDRLFGDRGDDALDGGADTDQCQGGANGPAGDTAIGCETVFGVP